MVKEVQENLERYASLALPLSPEDIAMIRRDVTWDTYYPSPVTTVPPHPAVSESRDWHSPGWTITERDGACWYSRKEPAPAGWPSPMPGTRPEWVADWLREGRFSGGDARAIAEMSRDIERKRKELAAGALASAPPAEQPRKREFPWPVTYPGGGSGSTWTGPVTVPTGNSTYTTWTFFYGTTGYTATTTAYG